MKQIIPLKKDIIFKSKIGEITNINIDTDYKIKDDMVDGFLKLYGSYKMTEASVLEEEFNYKIPFGVSLSKKIVKDSIKIDISDFNYKFNKDILSIDVDLDFECDEFSNDDNEEKIVQNDYEENKNLINELNNNFETDVKEDNNIEENITNITNVINNEENYQTYKVYIVRENDSLNEICNKYNVTLNDLKEYNDINNIQVGDKIVIPYINE